MHSGRVTETSPHRFRSRLDGSVGCRRDRGRLRRRTGPGVERSARGPAMPVEFDLARYQPVSPTPFRSLAYADNGKSFFVA